MILGKGLQLAQVSELSKLAKSVGLVRLCDLAGDDLLLADKWMELGAVGHDDGLRPIGCISMSVVAGPGVIILITAAAEEEGEEE